MSDTLLRVQLLAAKGEVGISDHGYDELAEDDIFAGDILNGVDAAIVVEDYPQATKGPSVLVLQKDAAEHPIHVVWGIPRDRSGPAIVVTAYRPDPSRWSKDFLSRKTP